MSEVDIKLYNLYTIENYDPDEIISFYVLGRSMCMNGNYLGHG